MYIDHVDTDENGAEIPGSDIRFCLNAEVADRLSTARTITLSGDATGSVNFDGSQDINLVVDIEELDNIKEAIEVLETKKPDLEEVNEQIQNLNNEFEKYLPLTAGPDKKLTGPLGLTAEIMYGPDLPLEENSFEGQLFFLEDDGVALPNGGTAGQVLAKNSDKNGDAIWVNIDNGVSLPTGGITGQVLIKNSNEDGDAIWADIDTITVDLDNTNIGSSNGINADTLQGKTEDMLSVANADNLGGRPATDYATENYVLEKIAEAQLGGDSGNIDLSGYATKEDLNNFITEIPSEYVTDSELTSYAKKSEIPDTSAFLTAEQVSLLINEALGVIENGSY